MAEQTPLVARRGRPAGTSSRAKRRDATAAATRARTSGNVNPGIDENVENGQLPPPRPRGRAALRDAAPGRRADSQPDDSDAPPSARTRRQRACQPVLTDDAEPRRRGSRADARRASDDGGADGLSVANMELADNPSDDEGASAPPTMSAEQIAALKRLAEARRKTIKRRDAQVARLKDENKALCAEVQRMDVRERDDNGNFVVARCVSELTRNNGTAFFGERRRAGRVKALFGFQTWAVVVLMADLIQEIYYDESKRSRDGTSHPYRRRWSTSEERKFSGQDNEQLVSDFQQYLMALVYLKSCGSRDLLAQVFDPLHVVDHGLYTARVNDALRRWLPRLGRVGRESVILPTDAQFFDETRPCVFDNIGYTDIGPLVPLRRPRSVDARDQPCECFRKGGGFSAHKAAYSSKIGHAAVRGVTAIMAFGLVIYATDMYLAKATESALFELMAMDGFRDLDAKLRFLVDKGFASCAASTPNLNKMLAPCFKKAGRLTDSKASKSRALARLRWPSEKAYAAVANLRVMRDPVSMEFLLSGHINDAWYWAHALANFQMPTLPPGGTPVPASPVGQVVELLIDDEVFAIAKCLDACVDGHLARVQVEEVVWDYEEDAYLPYGPSDARTVAQYILLEPLPDLWWPIALLRIRIEALADSDSDDGLSGSESQF